ncbi:MAG: uracil-DNA glycosylase [Clostridiales bacterium]|nr:uracil-DNA glycosylase [Clostridiales bacterium]
MVDKWDTLQSECLACKKCELSKTRNQVVFGAGSPQAKVLFVGEGPGEQEDLSGKPFVGRGGQLLDKFLDYVELDREKDIYIANIVKCRPPNNRDPLTAEQETCIEWLREQVRLMRPAIIVCLGRVSAQRMIAADFKVTVQHGEFFEKGGILFMGTFHPAAVLRDPRRKPDAFADFLKLREKMKELEI